jgi:hypothetical protein
MCRDTTTSSTGIDDRFNPAGLQAFINEEIASSFVESPILRYLFSVFPHLEQGGITSNGDLQFFNLLNGELYVLPKNGWAHRFNLWFDFHKKDSHLGYVTRQECNGYLMKRLP